MVEKNGFENKRRYPVEVLQAYHKLNRIYGQSVECINDLVDREKQKTIIELKLYCFQFIQSTLTNYPQWNPLTRQTIGGKMVLHHGAQLLTSMPPPVATSSNAYHLRWVALVKKVQVLLRKYDKTMQKTIDCKCHFDSPLLFELSLLCTMVEKKCPTLHAF